VPVASITSSITDFIGNHGVYAVFVLMLIDAVFPAASELVMLYAGALAAGAFAGERVILFGSHVSSGFWAFVVMALAGTIGYLVGSLVGWAVGAYAGRPYLERHGRWLHLSPEKLDRAERWFDRWGPWAVFLGRITPVVRSFVSIPAGLFRWPLVPYTALTAAGSAIWCLALAGAGWGLGRSYTRFHHDFRFVDYAVLLLVAAAVVVFAQRTWSRRLARRAHDPAR
jgi:membrane protein DedA with SNARE-associated domain